MVPFWGRGTTHFRTYFSGYDLAFDPRPYVKIIHAPQMVCIGERHRAMKGIIALPPILMEPERGSWFGPFSF